jgi:predicted DNA-binding transcriptional regulator AlpA
VKPKGAEMQKQQQPSTKTFEEIYALIVNTGEKHIVLSGEFQHLFTPPPKDGRTYTVFDLHDPKVTHHTDDKGRYKKVDKGVVSLEPSPDIYEPKNGLKAVSPAAQEQAALRLIQLKQVTAITGFGKTFIYDSEDFPKPVKLGHSRRAAARWVEAEVHAWIETLMSNRATSTLSK